MYLVQQILDKKTENKQSFRLAHMGAAEFEWGILEASATILSKKECVVEKIGEMWFVGNPDDIKFAQSFIKSQLGSNPTKFNEKTFKIQTRMGESIKDIHRDLIGWWWLSQNGWPHKEKATYPSFAVFKNHAAAISFRETIPLPKHNLGRKKMKIRLTYLLIGLILGIPSGNFLIKKYGESHITPVINLFLTDSPIN